MSPIKDGPSCPGCGLANYYGLCPHCRGDQQAYEDELVPPFPTSHPPTEPGPEEGERDDDATWLGNLARNIDDLCDGTDESSGIEATLHVVRGDGDRIREIARRLRSQESDAGGGLWAERAVQFIEGREAVAKATGQKIRDKAAVNIMRGLLTHLRARLRSEPTVLGSSMKSAAQVAVEHAEWMLQRKIEGRFNLTVTDFEANLHWIRAALHPLTETLEKNNDS